MANTKGDRGQPWGTPAETPNPKRIVTETGTPVEPKKATEKKKDDSMTMYIAAAALLALIMY